MTKPVTCVFLGSGASKALAGIPIQRNFLCSVLTEERSQWIDDCHIRESEKLKICKSSLSSWMLEVEDIELCMSYLHHVAYANSKSNEAITSEVKHARRAIVNLRAAIAVYLKDFNPQVGLTERFRKRFKLNDDDNSVVILTTNYDLVLEKLLSEYHYPAISDEERGIPIYKLHGSINWLEKRWFKDGKLKSMKDLGADRKADFLPSDMSQLKASRRSQEWAYLFDGEECLINGGKHHTYNPILVPFVYQKNDWLGDDGGWNKIFPDHWKHAQEFLLKNKLERIYFIGYSLPPADHHMLSFLLKVLNGHKQTPRVTIVCKGDQKRLEMALKPFQPRVCRCGLERFLEDHV